MPTYEYQCANCNHQFELMQKMSDSPERICPECHKETVQRLVSAAGFQLKGTGWYATDFKNKGKTEKKETNAAAETPKTTAEKQTTDTATAVSTSGKSDSD